MLGKLHKVIKMGTGYRFRGVKKGSVDVKLHKAAAAVMALAKKSAAKNARSRKAKAFAAMKKAFLPKRIFWKKSLAMSRRFRKKGY